MVTRKWIYKPVPPRQQIEALSASLNLNPYLTTVLLQRGIRTLDQARNFFRPALSSLHDPFLMKGMENAVRRLRKAMEAGEKILIYGDYDVDGTTAVSLVYSFLSASYSNLDIYIPDRNIEGYGVSQAGIDYAADNGFTLIIALDCGIKSAGPVQKAKARGVDFIICDHHLPGEEVPMAVAVLDPKQPDCAYPFKELSGCGLGFKLMQAYAMRFGGTDELMKCLDLVAVSIASDIVPISGENRVLAYYGLKKLNEDPIPGLKALRDVSGVRSELDISGVVFSLGPRINAAGRVAHASAAVRLLISKNEEEANALAGDLDVRNDQRRQFDLDITEEALSMIESNADLQTARSTVLFKDTWHKGVIGIVAARCVERFYRPTVILTQSNGKITGSARSVNGFDLYAAVSACGDLLEKFGGHRYAAGLTMDPANLEAFRKRFEEVVASTITEESLTPVVEIDVALPLSAVNGRLFNVLKQMAPFGPDNQRPVFSTDKATVVNSMSSFKERHLRFYVAEENSDNVFQAVAFDMAHHFERISGGDLFRMAYTIEENTYNGNTTTQIKVKDIQFG
jgi:single-stranded-DNA-specific exonuclease